MTSSGLPHSRALTFLAAISAIAVAGSAYAATPAPAGPPPKAPDLPEHAAESLPPPNPALPTVFVAGDSTAARGAGERQQGWGVPFAAYFDPAKVNVVNRARGGRSSRTFITEGLWDKLLADVKPGDIVLIQFGHNDGGAVNDASRARGSLPGLGEETQTIDNLVTKQREVVHTFGWYLRRMITDTEDKGAVPIVLSPTVRNIWTDGRLEHGPGSYEAWSATAAHMAGVGFIDLTDLAADAFTTMGAEAMKALYEQDHTHFDAKGADLFASWVVSGLKGIRASPINGWFSAKSGALRPDSVSVLNLPRPANPALPTLFLIGDSTVRNGYADGAGGQWGWGDFLGSRFDLSRMNVVNRAVGGLSSRTYREQGHWRRVLEMIKPGDFVMMQFGHNDDGPLNDASRARGTIKGVGDETEAIENLLTGQHEVVHSYGWYLRTFVDEARAKGATPIVCSPIPRKTWRDGHIVRSPQSYAGWARQVALQEKAPFVDLNNRIADHYDQLGPERVDPLFGDPHTHTSAAGADLNARCVVEGLLALPSDPLAPYLLATQPPPYFEGFDLVVANDKIPGGALSLTPTTVYTKELGYGFEPGAILAEDPNDKSGAAATLSSTTPFFLSVRLPTEGNYRVTVTLGSSAAATETTLKAELRRLMAEDVRTAPGEFKKVTFIVNTRMPIIAATADIAAGIVRLKAPRETTQEAWDWDERLTLEFNGAHPSFSEVRITPADVPTVFVIGDSTVCDQSREPYASWGQMLTRFLQPEVAVANHAESGETYRDSIGRRRLDKMLSRMRPGDTLLMQFGHNDQKQIAAGTGGPFTTYEEEIKRHVDGVRAHGGIPVIVSPMERRNFEADGKIRPTLADYAAAARQTAAALHVAFIDLNAMSIPFYQALGSGKAYLAFAGTGTERDTTHHDNYGAYELAKCVIQGIRADGLPIAKFIRTDFRDFDPAHPDPVESFRLPQSPLATRDKPFGS